VPNILVVEDDIIIAFGLIYALEKEGYTVIHREGIDEANKVLEDNVFDLAILDMQLPDGTGFDLRDKLKSKSTAIIFLTVVDDENKIVQAFENGADDYITKPFRIRELLARVKRTLNKYCGENLMPILEIGDAKIDVNTGKVYINDNIVELTALEYKLLLTFASNKGQILERNKILENIWDSTGNFVEDNTLTVYIKRLREKLGDKVRIETIRGIGYRVD
jgi:DNA-binding response OmpR family regulator